MTEVIGIIVLSLFGVAGAWPPKTSTPHIVTTPSMASRRVIFALDVSVGSTFGSLPVGRREQFVYYQSVNVERQADAAVSRIAAAIGEPARARILYCLVDGHARTSTELAVVADVSPSTASVHLSRLKTECLIKVFAQGKHRYYSLEGPDVASALEGLSVLAGGSRRK